MIPGLSQCPRRRSSRHQQQQESGGGPRSSRSSSSSSSSSHHFHHHNHHHHHHHQSSHRPRVSRTQITDFEQTSAADPAFLNDLATSSRTAPNADRLIRARMPLLAQQRSQTDAHRVAVEARGRLDERLREVGRRNPDHSLPRLAHHYFNALFSDDEEENFVWEDEHEWEASFSEWIAGRVPGLRESWPPPWMNELPATPLQGLSKAAVSALPREVYQQKKSKVAQEDQADCSVCLEQFMHGETLLRLPCKHKFHPACLTPWLETHEQCPYCRARITATASARDEPDGDNLLSWLEAFETGMSRRFRLNS